MTLAVSEAIDELIAAIKATDLTPEIADDLIFQLETVKESLQWGQVVYSTAILIVLKVSIIHLNHLGDLTDVEAIDLQLRIIDILAIIYGR
ncbi:MAG: hypothetical protein IH840_09740 [Candidatus Heimdallarchaeota archaeon]|nr:hypothetical protein [Candidatus Heimdallarchaeota archaeon]